MSGKILRVIDERGCQVSGSGMPQLEREELMTLYRAMVTSRELDERMTKLQRQGRIGFFVGSTGEEAAIIGSAFALQEGDWLVPCYREAGAALLRGYPLNDLINQIYGNCDDLMKGRQMPCHWGSPQRHLLSVSSPVGTQIPQATGIAMAATIKGTSEVVLAFFGDGATSTGAFHVACNFAGVFKAPVIFLCRNNHWAISTPFDRQTAAKSVAAKAPCYGFKAVQVDGNDVLAVYAASLEAAERGRKGDGPTLIEALTYRQGAHSTSDDPRAYRKDSEVEKWKRRDPISRFLLYLKNIGILTDQEESGMREEIREEIQKALKRAEQLPRPPLETLVEDVLDTVPWHLQEQLEQLKS